MKHGKRQERFTRDTREHKGSEKDKALVSSFVPLRVLRGFFPCFIRVQSVARIFTGVNSPRSAPADVPSTPPRRSPEAPAAPPLPSPAPTSASGRGPRSAPSAPPRR